jgi:hypothetical protein
MLKQIFSLFVLIALSAAVVFCMPIAQQTLRLLVEGHDWVSGMLTMVFNGDYAGNMARELVALLVIPLVAGLIPAIIYFLMRKNWLPYFMEIVWIVWLLQAGGLIMVYSEPSMTTKPVVTIKKPIVIKPAPKPVATPAQPAPEPAVTSEAISPTPAPAPEPAPAQETPPAPEPAK